MSEPTEAQLIYVRRSHPKDPPELVIVLGGEEAEHGVYILRPSQVRSLVLDLVRYAVTDDSDWARMWARKFDHPERI
jgi:hypothetical protein